MVEKVNLMLEVYSYAFYSCLLQCCSQGALYCNFFHFHTIFQEIEDRISNNVFL